VIKNAKILLQFGRASLALKSKQSSDIKFETSCKVLGQSKMLEKTIEKTIESAISYDFEKHPPLRTLQPEVSDKNNT
jgi:hypothetical protein